MTILRLLLDADDVIDAGVALCGTAADGGSDSVDHLIVGVEAVRRDELASVPTTSILALSDAPAPEVILGVLIRLLSDES